MSEMEGYHYCGGCERQTLHLFSGSGKKGSCYQCGTSMPEGEQADMTKVVSIDGV